MNIRFLSGDAARILLISTVTILPITAMAQLEEIVVTGQKREQMINDVGITVNAFTAEQLVDWGVKSAEDMETMVPGLTITNQQPAGAPVYTIRIEYSCLNCG